MLFVKIKKYQQQIILSLLVFILFFINYQSNTYLSGWDNLQTELNPFLAIKRAFFSVWQEYQSFGLLAGMVHASDLIRSIFVLFLSFIIPQNLIRYFYHFLMLLIGGLGLFKMLKLVQDEKNNKHENEKIPFIGALFYILNLGTVQIFYLPFESFSTFFAFLPWGIWSFLKISNIKYQISKKNLLIFFLINFLGTPSFYTQQLFVVYILILGLIILGKIFTDFINQSDLLSFKNYVVRTALCLTFIFLINSFWLLPQLYFVKTSSNVVYEAKANQSATDDVYFQNKEKGSFKYFLRLEGFYYDLFDKNNQFLFLPWKNHFKIFWTIQYFFSLLMILGLIYSIKKKNYLFVFPFILIAIVFLNGTWPINLLDQIIRNNKFLNQIFRSPFTKFIIPYSLLYSYFIIEGLNFIKNYLKNSLNISRFMFYILLFLIFLYSLPSFTGNFISKEMKVKIPQDYFEVINYFKNIDKNKRIALFPEYTFWGWFFHKWGYNGSGFLWYGIEQPIISRTFDVWSDKSEGYFWEIKSALEAEDINQFEAVLEKYDVDYLLIDYSLLPVVGSMKGLNYDRLENLFFSSNKIKIVKKWPNVGLYQFKKEAQKKDFISLKTNLIEIAPKTKLTDNDFIYLNYGDYVFNEKNFSIIYPFNDLLTFTRLPQKKWQIKESDGFFEINFNDEKININQYHLSNFNENFSALFYLNNQLASFSGKLKYEFKNNNLKIFVPKILLIKITENDFIKTNCFPKTLCFSSSFSDLPQKYSYLIKINNKNYVGRRFYFYILDQTKKQTFLEDRLKKDKEIYILPPKYQYGLGYSLTFHQNNYENLNSKNKIESIEVYLSPYQNLTSLTLTSPQFYLLSDRSKDRTSNLDYFEAKKLNYFFYEVSIPYFTIEKNDNLTLYLSQSYHPGWKAYEINCQNSSLKCQVYKLFPFIFGKEIKEHLLVNNWANGWRIGQELVKNGQSQLKLAKNSPKPVSTIFNQFQPIITIIFWPQYLQFLGFGLLILRLMYIILFYKNKTR